MREATAFMKENGFQCTKALEVLYYLLKSQSMTEWHTEKYVNLWNKLNVIKLGNGAYIMCAFKNIDGSYLKLSFYKVL